MLELEHLLTARKCHLRAEMKIQRKGENECELIYLIYNIKYKMQYNIV